MAQDSLSNSPSKLNLSRRQAALFQRIILAGNDMSDALRSMEKQLLLPKGTIRLANRWGRLMVELVEMLF